MLGVCRNISVSTLKVVFQGATMPPTPKIFFLPWAKLPYRVETPMSDRRLALLGGGERNRTYS